MRDVAAKIFERFQRNKAVQVGYRADLHLADFQKITNRSAKVLIGYNPTLGNPTSRSMVDFVHASVDERLFPLTDTAMAYPEQHAISVVLVKQPHTRKLDERESMYAMVEDAQYVDTRTAEVWNVEEIGDQRVLVRQADDDDIEAILKERRSRVRKATTSFGDIRTAGVMYLDAKDNIEYLDGEKIRTAVVQKVIRDGRGDRVLLEQANGKTKDISINAVTRKLDKTEMLRYYTEVLSYDPAYVKQWLGMDEDDDEL